jgi:hypothetical protein
VNKKPSAEESLVDVRASYLTLSWRRQAYRDHKFTLRTWSSVDHLQTIAQSGVSGKLVEHTWSEKSSEFDHDSFFYWATQLSKLLQKSPGSLESAELGWISKTPYGGPALSWLLSTLPMSLEIPDRMQFLQTISTASRVKSEEKDELLKSSLFLSILRWDYKDSGLSLKEQRWWHTM